MKLLFSAALVLAVTLGGVVSAQATSISYNLTSDECTGGCGPAGTIFGTVTLNDNGGPNVTVTVHLNSPYAFAKTGSVDFQSFLFSGVGVALGDITVSPHNPALVASAGPFTASGVGTFGFGINCPSCGNGLSSAFTTDIVFTVANATIADLTHPVNGEVFAADIGNTVTGNTGPVDAPAVAPEPTTLILLGVGLLGGGVSIRRRIRG